MPNLSRRAFLAHAGAVAAVPLLPRRCASSPPRVLDLQALVNAALESGAATVEIPPGRHQIAEPVYVAGAQRLVINGNNAELVASFATSDRETGEIITLQDCSNVTLRNLTVDFDPLPYTQGTVTAVDVDAGTVDLRVHDGYRNELAYCQSDIDSGDSLKLHAFGAADRLVKRGHAFAVASAVTQPDGGTFRFTVGPDHVTAFAEGDLAVTGCWRFMALRAVRCVGLVYDGITVWATGGAALNELDGGGGSDIRINVVPGPPPEGAAEPRLIAASRDIYNSADLRKGPVIHDCTFRGSGDDMIHMLHNSLVVESLDAGRRQIGVSGLNWRFVPQALSVGDTMIAIADKTRREAARSDVVAIERMSDEAAMLTLADVTGFEIGQALHVPELAGPGLVVRNTTFSNSVSAGVMLKSPGARVYENTIEHMGQSGIIVATDFDSFWGGPYARDVELRANTITDIGRSRIFSSPAYGLGAAIVIGVEDAADPASISAREFRDIRVIDNVIDGSPAWGLLVSNADGVELSRNRFIDTNNATPGTAGSFWGLSPAEVVYVRDSANVRLAGNTVEQLGAYATALIRVAAGSQAGPLDDTGIAVR